MPGPPTPMPLPQSFLAMLIPVIDPQRNGTAMHLQVISYFSRGLPIQAHQNPLDAQHYSRFLILLCLASNFQQLGDGGLISVRECWAHIAHHCSFFGVCRIIYAHLYSRRITTAPANGIIRRWSDLADEIAVRIADGVYAIPIAAAKQNNHLSFLRPSYFIATGPDSAFSFALCFALILLHFVRSTPV